MFAFQLKKPHSEKPAAPKVSWTDHMKKILIDCYLAELDDNVWADNGLKSQQWNSLTAKFAVDAGLPPYQEPFLRSVSGEVSVIIIYILTANYKSNLSSLLFLLVKDHFCVEPSHACSLRKCFLQTIHPLSHSHKHIPKQTPLWLC